eukprot:scaffold26604_cov116-Isochrysis_galbana.AAC.2
MQARRTDERYVARSFPPGPGAIFRSDAAIALSLCRLLSEPQPVPLATGAQSAIGGDWKRQPGPQPQRGAGRAGGIRCAA